jgi:Ser/Thr protein kinase RdoA (MazF antagonist)
MSDFYDLPLAERTERMRRLAVKALAQWGVTDCEPEVLKIRENAVFRVATADGRDAVLRVHRHGYHTDAALRSELIWTEALRADGIDVPGAIPTASGGLFITVAADGVPEPRQVDMLTWMPGERLGTLEEGLNPAIIDIPKAFNGVGLLMARLHNQAAAWPMPRGFVRHAWDIDGLVGPEPLWGRFWEFAGLTPDQRRLLETARDRAGGDLVAYGQSADRYGLIHADLNLDNLLLDGDRVVPLDFDDAGFGWHLFDFATVWTLFYGADYFQTMRNSVIEGYRAERDLPDAEVARMPLFDLARAFTYLGWVHTRSETATAQEISPTVVSLVCDLADAYLRGRSSAGL